MKRFLKYVKIEICIFDYVGLWIKFYDRFGCDCASYEEEREREREPDESRRLFSPLDISTDYEDVHV